MKEIEREIVNEQDAGSQHLGHLNTRQRRFVLGLLAGKSQAQAYRDAGYASQIPEVNASRLLRNAKVRDAFRELAVVTQNGHIADAIERQEFWSAIMRDPNLPLRERLRASELLGRAGGDFANAPEAQGAIRVEFALDTTVVAHDGAYTPPDPFVGVVGLASVPALANPDTAT